MNKERSIQRAIVNHLRSEYPQALVFHIPNGEARSAKVGALLQGDGVMAGAPDLLVMTDGHAIGLEVKTKSGEQKPEQIAFEAAMLRNGIPYKVVRTRIEAKEFVEAVKKGKH